MARLLRMPEVAANATEAVLSDWTVAENASFAAEDTIATVETEKAVVDVEAEEPGVVLKVLVPPGAQVEVGAPIAVLGDPGEQVADLAALLAELGVAETSPADAVVPERRDVPDPAPRVVEPSRLVEQSRRVEPVETNGRVFASPLARRLAKDAGIPVEEIDGTGPRRRILRRDVEKAVAARAATPAPPLAPAAAPPAGAPYDDVPHSRIRRATAARLTQSKTTAPHFYLRATVRADALVALRAEVNEGREQKVSLNDLVVKAAAAAHVAVPDMNVIWTDDAIRRFSTVDLAVAVATERGLLTPVVRDVGSLTVTALAAQVRDLVARARTGKLRQDDLEGGSMSVTNLGMYGTEEFAAIINPPHAAILAVGAVTEEPVVVNGALAVGKVLRLTLSVDHRPVDGVVAAQWMRALVDLLEHPVRILA
ncbi:dihydrolipoamide acetyltransferase family protein [Nocardioides iriomotensis]|uniref:Dihydrolipoamide acetyltransferase component of pyruvate dehydrogenase complex n=1 Tax=Nocardioides iriomotensis TaxID=715784 RepID=A0A4Q5ISW2_9ACTN|nr:dihydrolipoamide acetyltransferase family protein [Nocardioides iriomotensis]RYU08842.1 2-oxo acid dehydrogenase subunit E2 [Nocardioides iriomotensis]